MDKEYVVRRTDKTIPCEELDGKSLYDIAARLSTLEKSLSEVGYKDCYFDLGTDFDGCHYYAVNGYRLETDEEYQERLEDEADAIKHAGLVAKCEERREQDQLKELAAKYGWILVEKE